MLFGKKKEKKQPSGKPDFEDLKNGYVRIGGRIIEINIDKFSSKEFGVKQLTGKNGNIQYLLLHSYKGILDTKEVPLFICNNKKAFHDKRIPSSQVISVHCNLSELESQIRTYVSEQLSSVRVAQVSFYEIIDELVISCSASVGPEYNYRMDPNYGRDRNFRSTLIIDVGSDSFNIPLSESASGGPEYRGFWQPQALKYPQKQPDSSITWNTIQIVIKGEYIFTSATKEEIQAAAEAYRTAYQYHRGGISDFDPYVDCCNKFYDSCSHLPRMFWRVVLLYKQFDSMKDYIRECCLDICPFPTGEDSETIVSRDIRVSVQDAIQSKADSSPKEKAGEAGEATVDYVIKWLKPKGFHPIEKDCASPYGGMCIRLKNLDFIDEAQEFDHILVFSGGIINIETKNYGGLIEIDSSGQWTQKKQESRKGIESPVFQVDRHHDLLASIVGGIPIFDVICIANPATEIIGAEHSPVPVVKYDALQRYCLDKLPPKAILSDDNIHTVIEKINRHKVNIESKIKD